MGALETEVKALEASRPEELKALPEYQKTLDACACNMKFAKVDPDGKPILHKDVFSS